MNTAASSAGTGAVAEFPQARLGLLSSLTLNSLTTYFASKGHRPSPAMWEALGDLTHTLEAMADGTAPPKFFLSSLDPGVGKTQTITHFVDALLSQPSYSDVGVLVCVARLSEVEHLIHDMAIPEENLAFHTPTPPLHPRGRVPPTQPRFLFTPQKMIEKRWKAGRFWAASLFFYGPPPGAVGFGEKTSPPEQPPPLNGDEMGFLFKP